MYPEDMFCDAETVEEIEETDMTCNEGEDELVDPDSLHKQGTNCTGDGVDSALAISLRCRRRVCTEKETDHSSIEDAIITTIT